MAIQSQTEPTYFQTTVKPHPESIPNLTGWREPKGAYVLMEIPQYTVTQSGGYWTKGLYTVNAESRGDMRNTVQLSLNDGGKVLHYGNFPKLNDDDPERASKAQLYAGKGPNPWDELEKFLLNVMRNDLEGASALARNESEIDALKAKLQEEIKKREAAEKKVTVVPAVKDAK